MATYDFDLGVIGGGAAGLTVAAGAAQLGVKTLLVEKEPELGGDCLHYGCVPSKTLIRTARVYHQARMFPHYGLPALALPPVDYQAVAGRIRSVIEAILVHDSPERFCSLGARVVFGHPTFTDEHSVLLEGKRYSAAKWVLATGSSPAAPPIPGLDRTPYVTNKEIFSLPKLPEELVVLGGGPIALELAQAFNRLGSKVTLLQRSAQVLSKEDQDLAELVAGRLVEEGIVIHTGVRVLATREIAGGKAEVTFTGADGTERTVSGERLLVALGRTANVEGLGLEHAGVAYSEKGVPVDARMRTNVDHIYAAGDVTGKHQFTHAAGYEGGLVVTNACFHLPRKANYTFLPHCTYVDPELASIGLNEKQAQAANIAYSVVTEDFARNDRALAEGETLGRIKLILDAGEKPVGVQILGPHAGELINEWVAVLNGKVGFTTLSGAVHPYPTLGEINKRVVSNHLSPKIFSGIVPKALKFIFSYKGRACSLPDEAGPQA